MPFVSARRPPRPVLSPFRRSFVTAASLAFIVLLAAACQSPVIADEREVTLVGDIRVRPEFRDNADFNRGADDRLRFFEQRTRLGLEVAINPKITGRIVAQDSRFWGTSPVSFDTTGTSSSLGLLEGYIDFRWIWDLPLDARLGRQPLNYARERFISRDDWSPLSNTFDAYKFRFGLGAFFFDIWSAKLVDTNFPGATGVSDQDANLSSVYFSKEGEDRLELLDLYWIRSIDKTMPAADVKRGTFGGLGRFAITPDLIAEVEYAYQRGDSAATDIRAQALAAEIKWRSRGARKLVVRAGYDWATGDPDPTDGKIETFDQLFPDTHTFLGYMDYVGRQNIRDAWADIGGKLIGGLSGEVGFHWFQLDESRDAFYGIDGLPNPRADLGVDPARTERELGYELDLAGELAVDGADVTFGYSRWFVGNVMKRGGAAADDSDWAWLSLRITF